MNSADMDGGVRQSMVTYEDLFNATVNGKLMCVEVYQQALVCIQFTNYLFIK